MPVDAVLSCEVTMHFLLVLVVFVSGCFFSPKEKCQNCCIELAEVCAEATKENVEAVESTTRCLEAFALCQRECTAL